MTSALAGRHPHQLPHGEVVGRAPEGNSRRRDRRFVPEAGQARSAGLRCEREKLEASLGGIKDMNRLPDALFVIDIGHEDIAIKGSQARHPGDRGGRHQLRPGAGRLPDPGNDDAIRAVAAVHPRRRRRGARGKAAAPQAATVREEDFAAGDDGEKKPGRRAPAKKARRRRPSRKPPPPPRVIAAPCGRASMRGCPLSLRFGIRDWDRRGRRLFQSRTSDPGSRFSSRF